MKMISSRAKAETMTKERRDPFPDWLEINSEYERSHSAIQADSFESNQT